ncbi:GTP pyrophosphokinase [Dyella ginsengisoli]|uniref:GTP pyrophosphokinase n=1 Tax=Dyella ginsengisoli TaxID=363848 RepID=A0ABW8JUZ9_9GAMM
MLDAEGIPYVSVQGRCKELGSFKEKIQRKRYKDPKREITDLAGLRIITLVESDIQRVESVLRDAFDVNDENSGDKSIALGDDKFGYRSVHFVCGLGGRRESLPEHGRFKGLLFEIQVRTALQHAWAEIEHDRGYKLKGELPSHLKRRFALLAGLLELADSQFDQLSNDIDRYQADVSRRAVSGDLDIEINSSSVYELLVLKFGKGVNSAYDDAWPQLIQEIRDFGAYDLKSLSQLFSDDVCRRARESTPGLEVPGLIRDGLILTDIERYFKKSWKGHWSGLDFKSAITYEEHYGKDLSEVWEKHKIDLYNEDEDADFFVGEGD